MSVFLVVIVGLGWFVGYIYNAPEILYAAVIFSMIMNIVGYWNSDKIVMRLAGARLLAEGEDRELKTIVENLAITAGLPMPKIYIIDDPAPNAFATGRDKEHAAIAITSGLRQILDRSELEGVIAHELSHIGNRDTLLSTVIVVLVGFIAILSDIFLRSSWRRRGSGGDNRLGVILLAAGFVFAILSPVIATLIQLAISRKREFLADTSGALLTRYPDGLANALLKISKYKMPMQKVNGAIAHLYIANPLGRESVASKFAKWFSTHPPIEERVRALMGGNAAS